MKELYIREWQHFKRDYLRAFLWIFFICLGFTLLVYFTLVNYPDLAKRYMEQLRDQIDSQAELLGGDLDAVTSHFDLFLIIIKNNLLVSFVMFVLSFIPVVILPPYVVLSTFTSVGIALAFVKSAGGNPILTLLTTILPHGITEIVSMLFTASIGVFLSLTVAKKIFSRKRNEINMKAVIAQVFRSFALVSVPLIILSAIIEGFITPVIIKLF
jgi:stage II sporulation protein M